MTRLLLTAVVVLAIWSGAPQVSELVIGSKLDCEGQVLGHLLAQLARTGGAGARYQRLGGTQIVWRALADGQIDAYPEYTGTLLHQIFAGKGLTTIEQLEHELRALGLGISKPLGFNNTYALGMKEERARALAVRTISDLAAHPTLLLGFSNEFMGRQDGWQGLKAHYQLPFSPKGYEHALLYGAIEAGALDVIELYSTDSQIKRLKLRVLADDRTYFPRYDAVILYRLASAAHAPAAFAAMQRLEGALTENDMVALNARVDQEKAAPDAVARAYLQRAFGLQTSAERASTALWAHARQHLSLVAVSLLAAILIAVPIGIVAAYVRAVEQVVLAAVGIVQTIPSLALLVFMIPVVGLGAAPTVAALFLYSLLPIARNTYAGLRQIPASLDEAGEALGLSRAARLRLIDLPLASGTILAGIKTAAVINVGTATVGGLVGAGGFGQPIVTGLALNNLDMVLWEGALPAAFLAVVVQGAFEIVERLVVPTGLRLHMQRGR